jgi:hypothetical protein
MCRQGWERYLRGRRACRRPRPRRDEWRCLFRGFEGIPFAVPEAMSLGRPVVLSPLPSRRVLGPDEQYPAGRIPSGCLHTRPFRTIGRPSRSPPACLRSVGSERCDDRSSLGRADGRGRRRPWGRPGHVSRGSSRAGRPARAVPSHDTPCTAPVPEVAATDAAVRMVVDGLHYRHPPLVRRTNDRK